MTSIEKQCPKCGRTSNVVNMSNCPFCEAPKPEEKEGMEFSGTSLEKLHEHETVPKFRECDTCAAKPGMPILCWGCLHNRDIIENIAELLSRARDEGLQKLAHFHEKFTKEAYELGKEHGAEQERHRILALLPNIPGSPTKVNCQWLRAAIEKGA